MTGISFSFDPDWMYTLSAPFMTNAFLAGLCICLLYTSDAADD